MTVLNASVADEFRGLKPVRLRIDTVRVKIVAIPTLSDLGCATQRRLL